MKKLFLLLILQAVIVFSMKAQPVSDYSYKLDNGITVKSERCWNQVWVQQSYSPITAGDKTPISVNIRTLGDLISGSSFKLMNAGKEVTLQGAAPGTYDLRLTFKLSGKPGTLSFVAGNIIVKPQTKTAISVILYDYQILIDESTAPKNGISSFETKVNRFKGNTIQDLYSGVPTFYAKGQHDKALAPDEQISNIKGKIKPGTYDVLISILIAGQTHKIWLENFQMKPDINYVISTNLNSGSITYNGANKDVKTMHLYPAGTAAKQTGAPAPVKNLEILKYDKLLVANSCAPGTYDVLLGYSKEGKYEWRKSIAITTGTKSEVK